MINNNSQEVLYLFPVCDVDDASRVLRRLDLKRDTFAVLAGPAASGHDGGGENA
jgi:hypothetical protein